MNNIDVPKIIKEVVDYLLPNLTPSETSLYIYLLRNSILENGQNTIQVGKKTIAKGYGKGSRGETTNTTHISEIIKSLEEKGVIKIGKIEREGTLYTIFLPEQIPLAKEKMTAKAHTKEDDYFNDPKKREELFERDKWMCAYCGEKVTKDNVTLDHLIPQSKGGKNTSDNLKTSCLICNSLKSGKTYEEAAPLILKSIKERKRRN